jgi:hypothetical protein
MTDADKQKLTNVMKFDVAERQRLRRAALAQEAGLPAEAFAIPYAESQTVNITKTEGNGLLTKLWAIAATLGMIGGTGGALLWSRQNQPAANSPGPGTAPAPMSTAPTPQAKQLRVRWWVENGQIQSKVEELP